MKKRILLPSGLLAVMLTVSPGIIFAERIEGSVSSLNPAADSLTLQKIDPTTGRTKEVSISVRENTTFKGAGSLTDLKVGDKAAVDAEENKAFGFWEARTVEVFK